MNNNMMIPELKDVIIHEIEEYQDLVAIHVSLAKKNMFGSLMALKQLKFTILVYKRSAFKVVWTINNIFL